MRQAHSTLSQSMFSLVEVWKKSGMTQKNFCADKQIALAKFHYWIKKYAALDSDPRDFIPVKVSGASSSAAALEVHWADGKRIVFHAPVDAIFLKTLLS